ncbi:hypothetical protein QJS10_CPA01g00702 [Acorus calamus]|uniref:RNase H type-1 domain-containing protein n=1 Tax=Acorus calamus TaxID=4465 RepID=A0AAV9FFN4_ACOCL|nr:hypothetical protein QJS10_CPA01g00702 [Acorus calamus]
MMHWGAGAGFVIACSSPFRILGAGYEGWPWATPMRMEAEAIRIGLRFACTLGIKQIKICSDSLSVIQTLLVDGLGPPQIQEIPRSVGFQTPLTDRKLDAYMSSYGLNHSRESGSA